MEKRIQNLESKIGAASCQTVKWMPSGDYGLSGFYHVGPGITPRRYTPLEFESLLADIPKNEWPSWLQGVSDVLTGNCPQPPFRTLDHPPNFFDYLTVEEKSQLLEMVKAKLKECEVSKKLGETTAEKDASKGGGLSHSPPPLKQEAE